MHFQFCLTFFLVAEESGHLLPPQRLAPSIQYPSFGWIRNSPFPLRPLKSGKGPLTRRILSRCSQRINMVAAVVPACLFFVLLHQDTFGALDTGLGIIVQQFTVIHIIR
jgi:hypothetical protein